MRSNRQIRDARVFHAACIIGEFCFAAAVVRESLLAAVVIAMIAGAQIYCAWSAK
jgi:hypothetical protein